MFTIQGLLHSYKDRVCGPNLECPSSSKMTFCQITNVDCMNFNFSALTNDEKNENKGYSHILFLNKHAF